MSIVQVMTPPPFYPKMFNYHELHNITTDLNLSNEAVEQFGLRLNAKNLLAADMSFSWYMLRERDFSGF